MNSGQSLINIDLLSLKWGWAVEGVTMVPLFWLFSFVLMNPWVASVHRETSKRQHFLGQQALFSVGGFAQESKAPGRLANKAPTTLARVTRAWCLSRRLKIHQRDLCGVCVCVCWASEIVWNTYRSKAAVEKHSVSSLCTSYMNVGASTSGWGSVDGIFDLYSAGRGLNLAPASSHWGQMLGHRAL